MELKLIEPAKMKFLFFFTRDECHERFTGTCSLEINPARRIAHQKRCSGDYCPGMLEWMNGHNRASGRSFAIESYSSPITLAHHSCGHYSFNNGRHRACIAKKKGLKVLADIISEELPCAVCAARPDSGYYDLR